MQPTTRHERATGEPVRIYSAGHSNHAFDVFLALLNDAGVCSVVDVRSQPYSRRHPHFSRPSLEAALTGRGLSYTWLGDALGGRPTDRSVYADEHLDTVRVHEQPWFRAGIERLIAIAREAPSAMVCAERDPRQCHRATLIAPALMARGVEVIHLLADGRIDHRDLVTPRLRRARNLDLFDH